MDAARRKRLLAEGKCGFCGKPRTNYKFSCDICAERDRRRKAGENVPENIHEVLCSLTKGERVQALLALLKELRKRHGS